VSSKSSGHRHVESQIKNLERKFKSLSSKSCKDGAKGKDGDCNNICSEGFQLTFENAESNTGRAACCKSGEVVTPTGSCRPDGSKGKFVPPVCYQLKARLRTERGGGGSVMYLRGFEGEINGNTYRCANDGCCSVVLSSGERIDRNRLSFVHAATIRTDFAECGLSRLILPRFSDLSSKCIIFRVNDKFNFDFANYAAFYGGELIPASVIIL